MSPDWNLRSKWCSRDSNLRRGTQITFFSVDVIAVAKRGEIPLLVFERLTNCHEALISSNAIRFELKIMHLVGPDDPICRVVNIKRLGPVSCVQKTLRQEVIVFFGLLVTNKPG